MLITSQQHVASASFIYDAEKDLFISSDGKEYTWEQLDALDKMEYDWKRSLPRHSFFDWVKIFDGEQKTIAHGLRAHATEKKEELSLIEDGYDLDIELLQEAYRRNPTPALFRTTKEEIARLTEEKETSTITLKNEIAVLTSRINFLLGKKNKSGAITDLDIQRAKEVPIVSLIKVGRDHKALCPFHADTKPSLHVYRDNHAYCFVCAKSASSIDIYMQLHSCDFKTAVKALCL